MDGEVAWTNTYATSVVAAIKGESQKWVITGVYGPTRGELERIKGRWELPWYIGGDFNEVLLEEQNGATRRTRGMDMFWDFVDHNKFIDVQLDKFLVSMDWDDYFSPVNACALLRLDSDHMPILLNSGGGGGRR